MGCRTFPDTSRGCAAPAAPPRASPGRRLPWRRPARRAAAARARARSRCAVSQAASNSAGLPGPAAARPARSSAAGRPGRRRARPSPGSASGCRTAASSICWRSRASPRRSPMPTCTSLTSSKLRCTASATSAMSSAANRPVGAGHAQRQRRRHAGLRPRRSPAATRRPPARAARAAPAPPG